MSDRLADGQAFRVLALVDNVSPALEVDFGMTGERVCEVFDRAIVAHGVPKAIRLDKPSFPSSGHLGVRWDGVGRLGALAVEWSFASPNQENLPTMPGAHQ